jgi:hypothetical protein
MDGEELKVMEWVWEWEDDIDLQGGVDVHYDEYVH